MKKKMVTKMTAVMIAAAMLVACGGKSNDSGSAGGAGTATTAAQTTAASETKQTETAAAEEQALFNKEGTPIVNEAYTLTIGHGADALKGDYAVLPYFVDLSAESGITFEFVEYADDAAKSVMWASRDYPEVILGMGSDSQITDAVEAGDLIALEGYLEEYAPNIWKYLQDNPLRKAAITHTDGHIYALPGTIDFWENQARDMWFIQTAWLDELGLDMPTTTDEFYEVLKAFKDHAGEGTIPENVTPYYIRGITNNIGGGTDLINSFGVYVSCGNYWATITQDGKVEYNWVNPDLKAPLEYIHKLVAEGLISKDGFTDDNSTYLAKTTSATEPLSGSFHGYGAFTQYGEGWSGLDKTDILMPLDAGNGKKGKIKMQTGAFNRNKFIVTKECKNPEIAVRLADLMCSEYWSMYNFYGAEGVGWQANDDGSLETLAGVTQSTSPESVAPRLGTVDMGERLTFLEGTYEWYRQRNVKAYIDADAFLTQEYLYPNFEVTAESSQRLSELQTEIQRYITTTLTDWCLNGGIEEGWDGYISQLNALGLEEYLDILQTEYDRYLSYAK